ncbi:GNAT family N-acetyltransferase [Henriciella litoralis]|uniref:GNAT family N-acetyltransferase n=1 Tax=Henriciella litoralis TaxID=568102 RepID=UPI000A01632F|nr:GNAT family N-acetyltransferase [Henriciella litoralis]
MTDLKLEDSGSRLTADVDGHEVEIRYGWDAKHIMRVDFVGVPKALGGRGLGTKLVGKLVEKARKEDFRLRPVCGFARVQLQRHPEWQDVVA